MLIILATETAINEQKNLSNEHNIHYLEKDLTGRNLEKVQKAVNRLYYHFSKEDADDRIKELMDIAGDLEERDKVDTIESMINGFIAEDESEDANYGYYIVEEDEDHGVRFRDELKTLDSRIAGIQVESDESQQRQNLATEEMINRNSLARLGFKMKQNAEYSEASRIDWARKHSKELLKEAEKKRKALYEEEEVDRKALEQARNQSKLDAERRKKERYDRERYARYAKLQEDYNNN